MHRSIASNVIHLLQQILIGLYSDVPESNLSCRIGFLIQAFIYWINHYKFHDINHSLSSSNIDCNDQLISCPTFVYDKPVIKKMQFSHIHLNDMLRTKQLEISWTESRRNGAFQYQHGIPKSIIQWANYFFVKF